MHAVGFLVGLFFIGHIVCPPPVKRKEAQEGDKTDDTTGMTKEQLQDQEYFRYLTQIVSELEKDPKFKEKLHNASEEDIRTGKIAEGINLLAHGVRYILINLNDLLFEGTISQ